MPGFFRFFRSFSAVVLFFSASFALSQTVIRDIPYTTDSTGTYRADLYRPAQSGPAPAVVLIHGGSWRSGSKGEMRRLAADLVAHGYAGFSIDYDLHARSFPSSWEEVREAVLFLRAHAQQYGIDPQRIALLGTSAGGQLAMLATLAPGGPASSHSADAQKNIPVAAAISLNGVYDLHPNSYILRRYLGGSCSNIPDVCNDASPLFHVHGGATPVFIGHGNHDHLVPYSQATTFIAALQAAVDKVTPFVAQGGGHSYWKKHRYYAANLQAVEEFLDSTLRKLS